MKKFKILAITCISLTASVSWGFGKKHPDPAPSPSDTPVAVATVAPNAILANVGEIKLPLPEIETLPNGMEIVWFLSDNLPITDLAMVIKSGYRDDPTGKSGVSELLASTLDRGADGMTAQQLAKAVEELGASRYISADEETFTLGTHGLSPDADTLLDILAKVTFKADLAQSEVAREQDLLLDRWNHLADYGESLAGLAYRRALTAGTSYGRGNFSSISEFKKIKRQDLVDYYHKNFTPKNAILTVVGRLDKAKFRAKILADFGSWTGEAPVKKYKNYTDARTKVAKNQILLIDRKGLTQAQIRIGFHAPLITSPDHYPLSVGNALLGEYFNSRLNALIRDKLGLTYGIESSFSYSRDFAAMTITSSTRNETVGQLVQRTIEVLKGLKKGPIPDEEVQMAKEYLVGGFPLSTSTLGAVATRWMAGYLFNLGPNYLNEFVAKVSGVTAPEVQSAVAKSFDLDNLVIVIAGDSKALIPNLKESGFKSVKKLNSKDLL
jgi:zinc protease